MRNVTSVEYFCPLRYLDLMIHFFVSMDTLHITAYVRELLMNNVAPLFKVNSNWQKANLWYYSDVNLVLKCLNSPFVQYHVHANANIKAPHHWPFAWQIYQWRSEAQRPVIRGGLSSYYHDDVIKWKDFPRHWPFVRINYRSPVNPPTKASDAELWCFHWSLPWINGWVNNHEAGDLRRHRAHYDVILTTS